MNATQLKRNQVLVLNTDCITLRNNFKAGERFKFLGFQGTLIRASRIGDNAKLTTLAGNFGVQLFADLAPQPPLAPQSRNDRYNSPHADESGPSRRIVIASCLAGKFSGDVVIHLTPAEEREYNDGMAKLATLG